MINNCNKCIHRDKSAVGATYDKCKISGAYLEHLEEYEPYKGAKCTPSNPIRLETKPSMFEQILKFIN